MAITKPINILITTFTFPPQSNGVSHAAYEQAKGFLAMGHRVMVATSFDETRKPEMFPPGLEVVQFKVRGNANLRTRYTGEIDQYKKFVAAFRGDIILCHCWQIWSTDLAITVFHKNNAKKILVSHGFSANSIIEPRNILSWLFWRPYVWKMPKMVKAFDHLVFLSGRTDKDRFYDLHLIKRLGLTNYSIIPNGSGTLNCPDVEIDFKKKYGVKGYRMILQVANYEPGKNHKASIKAFYLSKVKHTTMVLIGTAKNAYCARLQRYVERLSLGSNQIIFLDKVPQEDLKAAYSASDAFLLPSLYEVQPLVLLDAMRSGIPFISTDVGCISDLPGGVTVGSIKEMAQKITEIIENEDLRKELGQLGRKASEETYSWENTISKYDLLLRKLVGT